MTLSRRTHNGGLTTETRRGFVHGAASLTSSTATSGVVQLVTASRIVTYGMAAPDRVGYFARRTVRFVPEPAPALLGVALALLLGGLGLRRRG